MKNDVEKIVQIFKALSCRARFDIVLVLLKYKECSVGKIAEELVVPQPNISQHLAILKNAGIIDGYRKGSQIYYKVIGKQAEKIITELGFEV